MKKQAKLEAYQRQHRQLCLEHKPLEYEYKKALRKLQNHNKKIKNVGNAIFDLKHNGEVPHVTDHAIVRYLQRVKKMDIEEIKLEVANHPRAKKEGTAIVTIIPEENAEATLNNNKESR